MSNTIDEKNKLSLTGIIVTAAVTAGFIWAAIQWFNRNGLPAQETVSRMQANELQAFSNLELIAQAQKKYRETDWDKDGKKTYAKYFVHLWTSVSSSGEPIRIDMIPKKVAFATEAARAVEGYYFVDLHDRTVPENKTMRRLDYEKEWAVMAVPVSNGKTGVLNFFVDDSGVILVNGAKYISLQYPDNPLSSGWTKIETPEQLKDFQKKITYPQENSVR